MNYLKQITQFYKLLPNNPLSASAQCLYFYLLNKNNELAWAKEFTVANMIVCGYTGLNRQALDRARNELKQKGYIDYKKGVSNHAGKYLIVEFVTQNDTQYVTQDDIQSVTQYVTQSDTQDGHTVSTLNKQNKTKLKHIEKENIKEKYFGDEQLNSSFNEWLDYKKQRKEKYTEIGLKKLVTQIKNQLKTHSVDEIIKLIDICISRNYKGIIFDMLPKVKGDDIPEWVQDWINGKD